MNADDPERMILDGAKRLYAANLATLKNRPGVKPPPAWDELKPHVKLSWIVLYRRLQEGRPR